MFKKRVRNAYVYLRDKSQEQTEDTVISVSRSLLAYYRKLNKHVCRMHVVDDQVLYADYPMAGETFSEMLTQIMCMVEMIVGNDMNPAMYGVDIDEFVELVAGISPKAAISLEDCSILSGFNPRCASPCKLTPYPNHTDHPIFRYPVLHFCVPATLFLLDSEDHTYNYPFSMGYSEKQGLPLNLVTGMSRKAYYKTLIKLNNNIVSPREKVMSELLFAADKLLRTFDFRDNDPLDLNFNEMEILEDIRKKNTSSGFVSAKFTFISARTKEVFHPKKSEMGQYAWKLLEEFLDDVSNYVEGASSTRPNGVWIERECLKWEILRWVDDVWSDEVLSDDLIDKRKYKVRLFYISSILRYMLDKQIYKPISNMFKYYQCAIGVKLQSGGFQQIWELLSGAEGSCLADKWEKVFQVYPELREREYGQGDWSKYDQTLLAMVLAVVAAMVCPYYNLADPETRYLITDFVVNVAFKIMYIYAMRAHFDVWGCMFSGKYVTSIGDTVYQMLLFMVYKNRLLEKHPNDDRLIAVIESEMIMFFFFGDDHLGGWPKVMQEYYLYDDSESLLHDFVTMCVDVFGMQCKKEEFAVYPIAYSKTFFYFDGSHIVEDLSKQERGPVFLQNRVSEVYLDDKYIGRFTYRATPDLVSKFSLSTSASADPTTFMCQIASLAYLAGGNLEFYDMCFKVYTEMCTRYPEPRDFEFRQFWQGAAKQHAFRMIGHSVDKFPDMLTILQEQLAGCSNGDGFCAFDVYGNLSDGSTLYTGEGALRPYGYYQGMYSATALDDLIIGDIDFDF